MGGLSCQTRQRFSKDGQRALGWTDLRLTLWVFPLSQRSSSHHLVAALGQRVGRRNTACSSGEGLLPNVVRDVIRFKTVSANVSKHVERMVVWDLFVGCAPLFRSASLAAFGFPVVKF